MDITSLIKIYSKEISRDQIKITQNVRNLCKCPYEDHPNGCPNYNKHSLCPPKAPIRFDILENYNNYNLVICKFNFKQYKKLIVKSNPEFFNSRKRIECVLYWQGSIKANIKGYIIKYFPYFDDILACGSGFVIKRKEYQSMESGGLNVFYSLKKVGIPYEIKPKNIITMVTLVMNKKKPKSISFYF